MTTTVAAAVALSQSSDESEPIPSECTRASGHVP